MSNKFWAENQDRVREDVTASRENKRLEPAVGRKRLLSAQEIAVDLIEADRQHREEFDETKLEQLARSMATEGQLQPIRVRYEEGRGKYVIIAGERRWRAAKLAGMEAVACIVDKEATDERRILRHQIIENALREDLRPTEQARAFDDLMKAEGWTGTELAEHLNISQPTVSRTLAILRLPVELQQRVDRGEIALTEAIKREKDGSQGRVSQGGRGRVKKEEKIRTSVGITITLKARKVLKAEQMEAALVEALNEVREGKRAA